MGKERGWDVSSYCISSFPALPSQDSFSLLGLLSLFLQWLIWLLEPYHPAKTVPGKARQ
jgi:hypothetical protein